MWEYSDYRRHKAWPDAATRLMVSHWRQQTFLSAISLGARVQIASKPRTNPLPLLGEAIHQTCVLRLDVPVPVLAESGKGHYQYPKGSLHVTVLNVDDSSVDVSDAVNRLRSQLLAPVPFRICGFGYSPDTIFLKVSHGPEMAHLRAAVRKAFEMVEPSSIRGRLFESVSFANVIRFGSGARQVAGSLWYDGCRAVTVDAMEIVQTDRYLSPRGTTLLGAIDLASNSWPDSSRLDMTDNEK